MEKNNRYLELFQDFDKVAAFDQIAAMFYDCNFSSTSKSEMELLMFNFYMNALIEKNKNEQGVIDYVSCSDYEIAKQLGITQDKVHNLKLKKQARYRVDFDWQKSLLSIKNYIRLDGKRIIIPVTDPNLNAEIRNYINQRGGFVDFESGKDYIRIRVEYFLMLIYETLTEDEKKKYITETRKTLKKANAQENALCTVDKMEIYNNTVAIVGSGLKIADGIVQLVNPQNTLIKVLHGLLSGQG